VHVIPGETPTFGGEENNMTIRPRSTVGLLCAVALASVAPITRAANVQFTGAVNNDFLLAGNWSDNNPPAADGDIHFIENGLTSVLTGTASVNGVIVGDISVGTFNIVGGTLNVPVTAGFPQGFSLGGHLNNHTGLGVVNLTNGATVNMSLAGGSPDTGFVGERADGALNIDATSAFNAPGIVWRIGQFGGFFGGPPPFTAEGSLNVQGNFNSRQIFLGVQGGDGSITVSGNGSLTLTAALHMSIETFRAERSATVTMVGSNATLIADDIIANTAAGEVRNQFVFVADAGGVSELTSADALLFNNAAVNVDLTAFAPMTPGQQLRLFDAAPGQLANGHVFGPLTVTGGAGNPSDYFLVLDDDPTGDVFLQFMPEPSAGLAALSLAALATVRRRRR
jgi:hypothetical protein